jgi:hypothetical protein
MRLRPRIVDWDSPSSDREATRKKRDEPRTSNELDTAGHFIVGLVDIFPVRDTMSRPMTDTPKRRARRQFTDEFKASAVRLVLDEGRRSAPPPAIST